MVLIYSSCFMRGYSDASHMLPRVNIQETPLSGILILAPQVFEDARGYFLECYNERHMAEAGIRERFVQDNHSYSIRNVVRGLHYQVRYPQGKLVRVAEGEILDVAVDLRVSSSTFGKWHSVAVSGENKRILWIPPGFAHGFRVLSEGAHVLYKATNFYNPEFERTMVWNDRDLNIDWLLDGPPIVSLKDSLGRTFAEAKTFCVVGGGLNELTATKPDPRASF
jgi:dTDP-4-dehydrorhamnose 3,5-epimerase